MMHNKKGLSGVVATSLLIVVAVAAIVSFQTWFNTYSSSLYTDVEGTGSSSLGTQVERVIDNTIYFNNNFKNLTITDVKVEGISCNITGSYNNTLQSFDGSGCLNGVQNGVKEVVVITDKGVFSSNFFYDGDTSITDSDVVAQQGYFATVYNDISSRFNGVIQTQNNNYFAIGQGNGGSGVDSLLVSFNSSGSIIGNNYYNVSDDSRAYNIIETNDNHLAFVGYIDIGSGNDVWVVKVNQSGDKLWEKRYPLNLTSTDRGYSIKQDSSNNFYIMGNVNVGSQNDCFVMKLDQNGNELWNYTYGDASFGESCSVDSYLSSTHLYFGGGQIDGVWYPYLAKIDTDGNLMWNLNLSNSAFVRDIVELEDGNIFVVAQEYSLNDFWLLKIDGSTGEEIWNKTYGTSNSETPYSIVKYNDDSFYLGGYVNKGGGDADFWLLNVDQNGNQIFNQTYGGTGVDYGFALAKTNDNNLVLGGEIASYGPGSWLVKINQSGDACDYTGDGECFSN